jgi:antitoxin component of MazEF toxin-antitoxin module
MITEGKILKWGNSFGLRISKANLDNLNLGENEKVKINIEKIANPLRELFFHGRKDGLIITKDMIRKTKRELEGDIL